MKCLSCGAELENGQLYCIKCGEEVQIVSDKNILEDDVLLHLMHEDDEFRYEGATAYTYEDKYKRAHGHNPMHEYEEENEYEDAYEDEMGEIHTFGRRKGFFYFILVDAIAVCVVSVIVLLYFR